MADLLLLDNDRRIAELCAWFLNRRGHRTRLAASYAQARQMILEREPDLLLADLELGVESGRTELPRLAAEGLLPPTLVVSGYLDSALAHELSAIARVMGTVAKPFDVHELLARVEGALARGAAPSLEGRHGHSAPSRVESMRMELRATDDGARAELGG